MALDLLFDNTIRSLVTDFSYKANGQSPTVAASPSVVLGDEQVINFFAPADYAGWPGGTGKCALTIPEPGGGATSGVFYIEYASNLTSGVLVSGKRYIIKTFVAGDVFTNVGAASNATGVIFTASGTTPTTWTNGSTLRQITVDIAYNASASTVETAMDGLSNITVATFTVTGDDAGPWTAVADSIAAVSDFLLGADNLYPQSNGQGRVVQAGDAVNKREQVRFTIKQAALTLTTSFTAITAGAPDIDVLQAGVVSPAANAIHSVGLTCFPYGGFFTLTYSTGATGTLTTTPIAIGSTAATVQAAIIAAVGGTATAIVLQAARNYYRVEFTGTKAATVIAVPTMTVSGVTFSVGRQVTLDLSTTNLDEYLEGLQSGTANLEIEIDADDTCLQVPLQVINDGIDNATTSSTATDDAVLESQVGYLIPAWRYDITDLTGGSANDLDAVVTTTKVAGYRIDIYIGSALASYVLLAATTAEASPGIIRPDDYAGGTNEKVWVQIA